MSCRPEIGSRAWQHWMKLREAGAGLTSSCQSSGERQQDKVLAKAHADLCRCDCLQRIYSSNCELSVAAALRLSNLQMILYSMALQDDSSDNDGDGGQAAAAQDRSATDGDGSSAGSEALEDGGSGTGVDLGANDDTAAQDDAPHAGEAQQPQVSRRIFGRPTSPLCLILVSFDICPPQCRPIHVIGTPAVLPCQTVPRCIRWKATL